MNMEQQQKLVLEELNLYFNNFKLGVQRVKKHQLEQRKKEGLDLLECSTCWNYNIKEFLDWIEVRGDIVKTGIEVLIDKKDIKMLGKGLTIKELKQRCKENKLKKYSKLDKLQLINLLMTI
jgi:hypothetical protein